MSGRKILELEFVFICSSPMLYGFLTTPEGLQSWFCNSVIVEEDVYTFNWEGEQDQAKCKVNGLMTEIKFEWMNRTTIEYTLFAISKSPITRETILDIKTFCDVGEEQQELTFWENAITGLKRATGG